MYLEVKDLKKSYGEGGGYVQVLKGITAGVEQGERADAWPWRTSTSMWTTANSSFCWAIPVPANPRCSTASEDWIPWIPVPS